MADTATDQPQTPADLLIPPFAEPDEWMKQKNMKKIDVTPGMIFRSQVLHGMLLSQPEREAMMLANERQQLYHLERTAHVQKYATIAAKGIEQTIGAPDTFQHAQEQNPGAYSISGIQPPTSQIPEPLGAPPGAPIDYVAPGAQAELATQPLAPAQKSAYLDAIKQVPGMSAKLIEQAAAIRDPYKGLSLSTTEYLKGANPEGVQLPITPQNIKAADADAKQSAAEIRQAAAENHVGAAAQNAAMEVVTKGGVTSFKDGTWQQKKDAMTYAATIAPNAQITIKNDFANRDVVPPALADVHGADYLKTLPKGTANLVTGLVNYDVPITALSSRTGERRTMIEHAQQVDPNFSVPKYNLRYELKKDFTKGKTSDNIVALDQALNHMGTVRDLALAVKTSGINSTDVNGIVNNIRNRTGDPSINNYETAVQAMSNELMRVFRQVNASEQETKEWETRFAAAKTPEQKIGVLQVGAKLLSGRVNAINQKWNNGMETTGGYPNILSPAARGVLDSLGGRSTSKTQNADVLSQADAILKGK